jgi:hypothetical protein
MSEIDEEVMRSEACPRAFRMMVWAFLCLLPFRFSVGSGAEVEIPPDAMGWLVFLIAFGWLAGLHPMVPRLRRLAILALILCLPRVVSLNVDRDLWRAVYGALWAMSMIAGVLLVWKLCELVAALAVQADRPAIQRSAMHRRLLYLLNVPLALYALVAAAFQEPAVADNMASLAGVFVGALLIKLIPCAIILSMMGLMGSAARMCEAARTGPTQSGEGEEAPQPES